MKQSEYALDGMKEICAFMGGRSEVTMLGYIRDMRFPARQSKPGGTWHSDRRLADDWRLKVLVQGMNPDEWHEQAMKTAKSKAAKDIMDEAA